MDFNNFTRRLTVTKEERERILMEKSMQRQEIGSSDGDSSGVGDGLSVVAGIDASRVMGSALRASQLQAAATPEPTFRQGAPPSGASSWAGSPLVPFDGDEPDDM